MGIAGQGRKKPQIDVGIEYLHPDPENPRLPEQFNSKNELEILRALKKDFDIEELAYSMAENGYFDEEPLVAIPIDLPSKFSTEDIDSLNNNKEYIQYIKSNTTHFTVVEGNRRLASAKILLSDKIKSDLNIKSWPEISIDIKKDLEVLPVIVYPRREEVLPYLGIRHITGIRKWDAFSKALYIAKKIGERGTDIQKQVADIQKQVADRSGNVRKLYLCYKLIGEVRDQFDLDVERAKTLFSYLVLSVGQGAIREFLGLPKGWSDIDFNQPVPTNKIDNLRLLFSWLFGEGPDGKKQVIEESRDITNRLSPVLRNKEATDYLIETRDLSEAYERSGGEKQLLLQNIRKANRSLEKSLGIVNRYKIDEVKEEINKCQDTLSAILKLIKE
ncbi:MAG: hypothetical protein PHE49_09595 [bacterium]|nr:hypothetical protein [bacterium]